MPLFHWTPLPPDAIDCNVDQRPSWARTVALGAQYLVVMLGATVGPMLMGFDPNLAMLMCGVATLVFYVTTSGQVPSFMGCSSVFIGVVVTLTAYAGHGPNAGLDRVLGAVVVGGLLICLLGMTMHRMGAGWVLRVLTPTVNGSILLLVGASLAVVPARMQSGNAFDKVMLFLTAALVAVFYSARSLRVRQTAVLLALLSGTALHAVLANGLGWATPLSLQAVRQAAWIGMPALRPPELHLPTVLTLLPLTVVLVVETLSHVKAVGDMTGRDLRGQMGPALIGDGLGTVLSGGAGGPPMTSYAENVGIMMATRVYSTAVLVVAALLAVGLGLSPRFGAVLRLIPAPVLGGVVMVVFGTIAVAGIRLLIGPGTDLRQPRTQLIIAVPLMLGAGHFSLKVGDVTLDGIAIASFAAIALELLLPRRPSAASSGDLVRSDR